MPELPEVETIVRGLTRLLNGRVIKSVLILNPLIIRGNAGKFAELLTHKSVNSIRRHGKFIFISLADSGHLSAKETGLLLKIHLGMTGQLLFEPPDLSPLKHTHVVFRLSGLNEELRYRDIRRFGFLELLEGSHPSTLGPDAWLSTDDEIFSALRKKSGMLKHALLNQKVIAGLGNIYVDESLYRCGLHPRKNLISLNNRKLRELCGFIREVLAESINLGGTSFRNYVDTKGGRGGYKGRLKIYGRTGKPCLICGVLIKRILVAGRGSHVCPKCQPAPRKKKIGSGLPSVRRWAAQALII